MAEYPDDLKFLDSHEWARLGDDGVVTVGISDFAQEELGDVVFVELPELDSTVSAKDEAGVESSFSTLGILTASRSILGKLFISFTSTSVVLVVRISFTLEVTASC